MSRVRDESVSRVSVSESAPGSPGLGASSVGFLPATVSGWVTLTCFVFTWACIFGMPWLVFPAMSGLIVWSMMMSKVTEEDDD